VSENKGDKARFQRELKKRNLRRRQIREQLRLKESGKKGEPTPKETA
jgi:hypothetical protein